MVDPEIGMFAKENVKLLLDEDATREHIWRALGSLRRAANPDDTVWIYYSGHGAPEGDAVYWVTYDADVDDLYGTAMSSSDVQRVLADIKATRLITFLDCCHAAATTVQKHPTRGIACAEKTLAAFKGKGRVTFSSSDGAGDAASNCRNWATVHSRTTLPRASAARLTSRGTEWLPPKSFGITCEGRWLK